MCVEKEGLFKRVGTYARVLLALTKTRDGESAAQRLAPGTSGCMATERVAYLPDPVKREDEAGYPSPAFWDRLLEVGLPAELVSIEDVCSGCLSRFSVLCVPGGFVLNYQSRLGPAGAAAIADFVRSGGGYLGVCAGAYLGSTMCLSLLPVEVLVRGLSV